jgi:predicted nucleic acid-binding protein
VRLYLDTAPIIYTVEQVADFAPLVDVRLSVENVVLVVSDLTRMECRVKLLRDGDNILLHEFDEFLQNAVAETVSLSREVIDKATEIRATYGFKTPDSIHLAAAIVSRCDAFYTNDHDLDRFADLTIEVVGE